MKDPKVRYPSFSETPKAAEVLSEPFLETEFGNDWEHCHSQIEFRSLGLGFRV